ncbi:MAG: glutaredoxin 3 [Alteromonadaceae bacterium]|jgi:glutaredoxin 3
MTTQTSLLFKIKEVMTYGMILAVGLGIGMGVKEGWSWYNAAPAYVEMDTSAHFINTTEKVVVYSTQWCPYCKKARDYLTDNNIAFVERDIEMGDAGIDALYRSTGAQGIPQIVVGNKIITGFNLSVLNPELKRLQLL